MRDFKPDQTQLVEGLQQLGNISNFDQTNPQVNNVNNAAGALLVQCINANISSTAINPFNALCGPLPTVPGGSLNRTVATGILNPKIENTSFEVYPNPVLNKAKVRYAFKSNDDKITIELYNSIGQKIATLP